MRRALVTGAGGFMGRHLCALLDERGVEIQTLGPRPTSADHHLVDDPTNLASLTEAVRAARPTAVFHLAGVAASTDPTVYYRVNAAFAAGLLAALERTGQGTVPVLLVGSASEYGPIDRTSLPIDEEATACPVTDYGISKLAQTQIGLAAAARGRPIVVARPFNVIGPCMPTYLAVGGFASQIASIVRGEAAPILKVGNLAPSRDLIDVRDVVTLLVALLETPEAFGRIANVCTGIGTSMQTVVTEFLAIAGVEIVLERDEARIKNDDIPAHYGSPALLTSLAGPLTWRPLHDSLLDTLTSFVAAPPP